MRLVRGRSSVGAQSETRIVADVIEKRGFSYRNRTLDMAADIARNTGTPASELKRLGESIRRDATTVATDLMTRRRRG